MILDGYKDVKKETEFHHTLLLEPMELGKKTPVFSSCIDHTAALG